MNYLTRDAENSDKNFIEMVTRVTMKIYVSKTWKSKEKQEKYFLLNTDTSLEMLKNTKIIYSIDSNNNEFYIGRYTISHLNNAFVLDQIHILPEYQNNRIGTSIIKKLIFAAKESSHSFDIITLKPDLAHNLYTRLGMYKVEKGVRYFMSTSKEKIFNSHSDILFQAVKKLGIY